MLTGISVGRVLGWSGLLGSLLCGSAFAAPPAPANLRCEYRVNPLGIDTPAPRLSWELQDTRRGAMQKAYQVLVTATPAADQRSPLLDTGRVDSDASVHVTLKGLTLESGKRYYWRVRTWDAAGEESPYSEAAWWEMGLLKPGDWSARWITAAAPEQSVKPPVWGAWIWNRKSPPSNATVFFRLPVAIDPNESIESAIIKITADNAFVLHVNEQRRGEGNNWQTVYSYNIGDDLRGGRNLIAVRAMNADGPAGLIVAGRVTLVGGKTIEFRSSADWKTSLQEQDGWMRADFDDATWEAATAVTSYGGEPWKELREQVGPRRSMYVRKDFAAKAPIVRARAYASGLGLYELHLNGQRVGEDVFAPGWTHYPLRVQYQTYDVTGLLKQGDNTVGAILGNGWWSGGLGWEGREQYSEGPLRCIVQLRIDYEDGSHETVASDASWTSAPSPVTRDSFYNGETHDATLEMPGWDAPGFNASKWKPVAVLDDPVTLLRAQVGESIQVTQEIPAQQITEVEKGVFVADFGQNVAGRPRLKVTGPRGTRVRLRYAEVLTPEGRLYRDNYRTAEATDVYILKGGAQETWEPRFTYRGFRYCEITGFPGVPARDALTLRVMHSAAPPAGQFTCSNWLISAIHDAILWGQRSNLYSVPTDCPQRDERLGWMGDAQTFAPTACWNMQLGGFFTKWMRDVSDSRGKDGHVTDVSPVVVVRGPAAPGWGDAVVIVPWTIYQFYGDTRIIEENYDAMKGWVEYMLRHSKDHLYEREGYGDWVATVESPKKPIGTAYFYRSTDLLARMAAAIGRLEDARRYAELASNIARAFHTAYFEEAHGQYTGGTQTANLLPLWFGITPAEKRDVVLGALVRDIEARGNHLTTGFLGTPCLMPVLANSGHQELAWRLATQTSFPSWGYMIRNGATTIWELWDSDKRGPGMNSRNHFALGVVGEWFFTDLGGINADPRRPGFKASIIRPRPAGDLLWVRCEYPSPYGTIRSEWQRMPQGLTLTVTIPANTTSEVWVPTLGRRDPVVSEGGRTLLQQGRAAETVEGVTFSRLEPEHAVFDVVSGTYTFVMNGAEPLPERK